MKNIKTEEYRSPRVSSELPDCSLPLTFDTYNMCSFGCSYCFARYQKGTNPLLQEVKFQQVNVPKFEKMIMGNCTNKFQQSFYNNFFSRRFIFHWGGLVDPFCKHESKRGVGFEIMNILADLKYPTLFSLKGGDTLLQDKYLQFFDKYKDNKNFAFQISIVANDDELSNKIEPGTPSTSKRIQVIKELSAMGYYTILRLRPFIIGVTDLKLKTLLNRAKKAGIRGLSTEFFAIDYRINDAVRKSYKHIQKLMGINDLVKYFALLSPKERGGYLRLNRFVKEEYIKWLYTFCINNNIEFAVSDPDFKELCTTSCCCGLPDVFEDNPEMTNYSKNQITHHIRIARKLYHTTGEIYEFKFEEIYKDEPYFDDHELACENIGCVSRIYAQRKYLTLKHILQTRWNDIKNQSNPLNYFHGKVVPKYVGKDGNMVYVYKPLEYETRWVNEGIDLKR